MTKITSSAFTKLTRDTWGRDDLKIGGGWCISDSVYFWRRSSELKWVDKHTQISNICVIELRLEIGGKYGRLVAISGIQGARGVSHYSESLPGLVVSDLRSKNKGSPTRARSLTMSSNLSTVITHLMRKCL